ncbi:hypothetical protein MHAE_01190 [Mycobacterium haemophilum DSM 44634]|uniref:hypothetical protein n=1 Tax=Mycobacterium haemophilum TaxID=29311 RepID=UPI000655DAF3|nr:hypothetical protein [Mycobacterium haemophilum]AKN16913.1 hypothetical protein B586_10720 [Mycobacterium haemophilum DSM 44634]MCV7340318.1 hypothetical protein [Mycobacterium haemophilum DSM 44634]
MSVNIASFYHDPLIFLDEFPVDRTGGTLKIFHDRFDREVLRETLTGGLEVSASVEGEFKFDFSAVSGCAVTTSDLADLAVSETKVRRTLFMNAYLAFFYTRALIAEDQSFERMIVTPELMITNDGSGMSPSTARIALSRFPQLCSQLTDRANSMRVGPIGVGVAQQAAADLSALIQNHPKDDDCVLLVDLYLRASKAYQDYNYSLSVITYWTIIERLLNDLWTKMLQEESITGKRRKRLEPGTAYTAAVMTEVLVFNDYIPRGICDDIADVRKCRNDWVHKLKAVNRENAVLANSVCEQMLKLTKNLTLKARGVQVLRGI